MLNRIRNLFEARTEKKLTKMATRMFAFVEPRFDDIVETATQGVRDSVYEAIHDRISDEVQPDEIEAAISDAVEQRIDRVERYHDFDDIVREAIEERVDGHYFEDFDEMAREKIDDRLDYDLDTDEAAREAVDRWFNSNRDSVDDMVDRAIRQQLEETLEDAPHIAARLVELGDDVHRLAEALAEAVTTLDSIQDDFTPEVRNIAREEVLGIIAQVGRILDLNSYHPEASE